MIRNLVGQLPFLLGALVVVGLLVLLSVILARVTHVLAKNDAIFVEHNELAGFIFAVVGVIYAVLLAFVCVGVWERFTAAEDRTYDEAGQLLNVYRDAGSLGNHLSVRQHMRLYVESIILEEWPQMQRGGQAIESTREIAYLVRTIHGIQPKDPGETALYGSMLSSLSNALLDRDARITEDETGLSNPMWWIVMLGAFVTIGFTYLFGFRRDTMQAAMIGTLALMIGLVIYLTLSLEYPFRGTIQVRPDAFEHLLVDFNNVDRLER